VHYELVAVLLDLLIRFVAESLEGKWENQRNIEKRKGKIPGVGKECGE